MDQKTFIDILFNDCGFDGPGRRAWLQREYGVRYADTLSVAERSRLIARLKNLKSDLKESERATFEWKNPKEAEEM